jgi:hypothetical protein
MDLEFLAIPRVSEPQSGADILLELQRRGAEHEHHARGSLFQHLCGTRDVLATWGQPVRVCLAGLVHSGFSTESFAHALFDVGERGRLRELIGEEAEHIVYLFCAINRDELFGKLRANGGNVTGPLRLENRLGGPALDLARRDVGDLLLLHMANAADQACLLDGAPTRWISTAAELAGWATNYAEVVPPIFERGTLVISRESEDQLLETYDSALRAVAAEPGRAWATLRSVQAEIACVAEPLIWLGFLSVNQGDAENAGNLGARASVLLDAWGTPWDKRLSLKHWKTLARILIEVSTRRTKEFALAKDRIDAALALADGSPEDLYTAMGTFNLLPPDEETAGRQPPPESTTIRSGALPLRFERYIARSQSGGQGLMYPGLTAQPWHDSQKFPLAVALEQATEQIEAELRNLDTRLFVDEAEAIDREGRWSVLFLTKHGVRCDDVCAMCPVTASVLDAHASATKLAGVSYFSCLDPGTRVAPHRGATNTRLRCHLGIEVPDHCGLRVGGITGVWERGRCIVFDDSFIHEVWNLSDRRRVVLIVDMWHPDLTDDEVNLLQWMST